MTKRYRNSPSKNL